MKTWKRLRIGRALALGLAVAGLSAAPAQAMLADSPGEARHDHGFVTLTGGAERPDDRAAARGPGAARQEAPVPIAIEPGGFDWADAGIGAGASLGLVLLVSGTVLVARRRRRPSIAGVFNGTNPLVGRFNE